MRFLANENVPRDAIDALRGLGHDVAWVRDERPGIPDSDVLAWAVGDRRILVTFDKDFGELAWRSLLPPECGVVLFRVLLPPASVGAMIAEILSGRDDWAGHFSVIETGRIRLRPLPRKP